MSNTRKNSTPSPKRGHSRNTRKQEKNPLYQIEFERKRDLYFYKELPLQPRKVYVKFL